MRILFLVDHPEHLPGQASGAAQRSALVRQGLLEFGEVITLLVRQGQPLQCKKEPAPGVVAEIGYPKPGILQRYGPAPDIFPLIRSTLDLDAFDLVVSRFLGPLSALPAFRGRAIVDADDSYYRYPADSWWHSQLLAAAKSRARTSLGRSVLRRADHVWFCCQRDLELFSVPSASILLNVTAPSDITAESVATTEPVVLMVGPMWYRPNRDAVEDFIKGSWATIRRLAPGARFRIVGVVSEDQRRRWESVPGVECAGFVDDLASEYRRARLTLATIRSGGGTQIKALESLSHGRVPVVSSFVAGGYAPHLKDRESLFVADEPDEQIRIVAASLKDPSKGEQVAARGQEIVREIFSQKRFLEALKSSLTPYLAVRDARLD